MIPSFLRKLRLYLTEKSEVNYLYFSVLLIGITFFALSHFLLLEHPVFGVHLFFLIYALGQALLETWVFILIACVLKKWAPRWFLFCFISLSFLLLLLHFTNFTMLRLMDVNISYPFKFLFGAGIDHLIVGIQALNMNLGMMMLIFLSFLFIPFLGLLLYWATNYLAKKKPWSVSPTQIALALTATCILLLSLDFLTQPYIHRVLYKKYQKTLPFGATFLGTTPQLVHLSAPLPPFRSESEFIQQILPQAPLAKPNVYLFIIETLRRDFVNEEIAPHLTAFGKENIAIASSFSNANGTQPSWFAIFYSAFPFHWTSARDQWKGGAPSLQLFKKLGYKIRIYSSADLRYFGMDRILLGEKKEVVDHIEEFCIGRNLEPCDRDASCIDAFEKDIGANREGNLFVFFLDSTHSEYSFPHDFPLKFEPIAKQIDYLTITPKELEPVKNRYRNAIAYIDTLIDRFCTILKKESLYESSVIAITGDHGEEFFEEGALFHGTHLNRYQTEVPLFFKCPRRTSWAQEATHIDIFPSFLHQIAGLSNAHHLFDGTSIFAENRPSYRISIMQNGPDTPREFLVAGKNDEVHGRFLDSENFYSQTEVEIIDQHMTQESDAKALIESCLQIQ